MLAVLLNNIFGVDIDQQAVEVTKLSLLLKVLEEENEENIDKQLKLFAERALPNLHDNIKCGNSLIGWDIMNTEMSAEEVKRINPFDWDTEFADIVKAGGFDAVIGNPPYVRQETLGQAFKDYVKKHYEVFAGTADLYVYFFERGHSLLRKDGYFGMICSNKFMRSKYGVNLRKFLSTKTKIIQIIDFGELPVFQNAATFPAIFITQNSNIKIQNFVYAPIKKLQFESLDIEIKSCEAILDSDSIRSDVWTLTTGIEKVLIEKLNKAGQPLGSYLQTKILRGIITGLTDAFVIDVPTFEKIINEDPSCVEIIKPFLIGDEIRKYHYPVVHFRVILIPRGWTNQNSPGVQNKWQWFKGKYPAIARHLEKFSQAAEARWDKGDYWWELRACDYYDDFLKPKIIFPDIAKESRMLYDVNGFYLGNTAYFIQTEDLYLLGVLNSKLIFNYYKRIATVIGDPDKGGRLRWFTQDVVKIPIHTINFSDPVDKARHDRMVTLVTQMLDLNKRLQDARLEQEKTQLSRQIAATDASIDKLVYELYGLTEEEIAIVEGNGK